MIVDYIVEYTLLLVRAFVVRFKIIPNKQFVNCTTTNQEFSVGRAAFWNVRREQSLLAVNNNNNLADNPII